MNYDEFTTRDLRLELESTRVKSNPTERLAIENELLKRESALLKSELQNSHPRTLKEKIRTARNTFISLIVISIPALIYFDVLYFKVSGDVHSPIDKVKSEVFLNRVFDSLYNLEAYETIKLFPKNTPIEDLMKIEKSIKEFKNIYRGKPSIRALELDNVDLIQGSKMADSIYIYNAVLDYSNKSVALKVYIIIKSGKAYLKHIKVIQDMPSGSATT